MSRSERWWIAGATLAGAAYAFAFLLLRARGLTFYWDDWIVLERIARLPRPASWLVPYGQHFTPVVFAVFDLERVLFGADHTLWLAAQWAIHSANLALLALLLRARCGDARVAAVVTLVFGVAPFWRECAWAVIDLQSILCFTMTALGFLAGERARASRERRWTLLACAAVFLAPLCWGGGFALGPALCAETWALAPRAERRRRTLPIALSCAAIVVAYLVATRGAMDPRVARTPEQLRGALFFMAQVVGSGFAQQLFLLDFGSGPLAGLLVAFAYAILVVVVAYFLREEARTRLILAHVYLLVLLAPIAIARWWHNDRENPLAAASRYQYMPALAWTTLFALALARAPRRPALAGALVVAAVLAVGHERAIEADRRTYTPWGRRDYRDGLGWVNALERAARAARGPLYDTHAPLTIAEPVTRASAILAVIAPDVAVVWTTTRTPATTAALDAEPGFGEDRPWR